MSRPDTKILCSGGVGALVHTLFRTLFRNGRFKFMFCRDIVVSLKTFSRNPAIAIHSRICQTSAVLKLSPVKIIIQ